MGDSNLYDPAPILRQVLKQQLVSRIRQGQRPLMTRSFSGEWQLDYFKAPGLAQPRLWLELHFQTCVIPGHFGLGKVVGTADLLPGEKREIVVSTYERKEETRSRAESVFDSFSTTSADSFERSITLSRSSQQSKGRDLGYTQPSRSMNVEIAGMKIGSSQSGGFSGKVSKSSASVSETINSSVTRHSSEANSNREISVSSSSEVKVSSGTETALTRKLENLNWSRTLNFIFRQINQRFAAITYLDEVTFFYSNGFEMKRVTLMELDELATELFGESKKSMDCIDTLLRNIRMELCNIEAFDGSILSFIECVEHKATDCCSDKSPHEIRKVMRKKRGLSMCHEEYCVQGIIVDAFDFVMRTPGVFVDTLMGQNESLDCYNTRLQLAAADSKELDNKVRSNRESLIASQTTPQDQAQVAINLKKAECCPEVICGCKGGE